MDDWSVHVVVEYDVLVCFFVLFFCSMKVLH